MRLGGLQGIILPHQTFQKHQKWEPFTPPLDFGHNPGFEIPAKHKEAIRQLHWFGKVSKLALQRRYKLGDTTISKILGHPPSERFRPNRKGKAKLLSDYELDGIIEYLSDSWAHRILDFDQTRY